MAFRDRNVLAGVLPTGFYNVNYSVGRSARNFPDDVMLVQLLLKKVYDKDRGVLAPPGEMEVTGFCGPTTMSWIQHFQLQCKTQFQLSIATDGVVDRCRERVQSTISRTIYTILHLNAVVRKGDPGAYEELEDGPDCPLALGQQLLFNGPN
jgi:hypothetical protein